MRSRLPLLLLLVLSLPTALTGAGAAETPPKFAPAAGHQAPIEIDISGAPLRGSSDAPVTIVEFLDFQCPFCARTRPVLEKLLADNPGKVRLAVLDFPLPSHRQAYAAAEAARVAQDQGKYWEMHDALLENASALSPERIRELAADVGLDMAAYDDAMARRSKRMTVSRSAYQARRLGVDSTPTLFVNGYLVVDRNLSALQELIDDLAAGRTPRQQPPPPPPMEPMDTVRAVDPVLGNPDAPVTLLEFSDFHCPYCRETVSLVRQIVAEYPDQVRVVYKQFPLRDHRNAPLASLVSLAAHAQGKFWEMHDKLFAAGPDLDVSKAESLAADLGLDMEKFRAILNDPDTWQTVEEDLAMGQRAGVTGTPTLFVNNRPVVQRELRILRAMIETELRESER